MEFQATFYTAVPTMHQILLSRADSEYPSQAPPPLRFIRSCSSSLAPATLQKLEATFHTPVLEVRCVPLELTKHGMVRPAPASTDSADLGRCYVQAYAMTEASHQMTSNPLPKHGPHKPGTVGRAQGSVQVAVLDGNYQRLPTGKIGEVCIRGPNVTKGYLNNPTANKEAYAGAACQLVPQCHESATTSHDPGVSQRHLVLAGGWFHTGDQGFLDEDGFLTLTGRIKELINRGGEKISPIEVSCRSRLGPQVACSPGADCRPVRWLSRMQVDGALLSHPAVAEAVSFAAPDEKFGEIVAAAVVLSQPADDPKAVIADIRRHAATKLAKFKVQMCLVDGGPRGM